MVHPDLVDKAGGPRPQPQIGFRRKAGLQPERAAAVVGVPPSGGRTATGGRERRVPGGSKRLVRRREGDPLQRGNGRIRGLIAGVAWPLRLELTVPAKTRVAKVAGNRR